MLTETSGSIIIPRQNYIHQGSHSFRSPLEPVEVITVEHVSYYCFPEICIIGITPACCPAGITVSVNSQHFIEIFDIKTAAFKDPGKYLHAPSVGRFPDLTEKVPVCKFK